MSPVPTHVRFTRRRRTPRTAWLLGVALWLLAPGLQAAERTLEIIELQHRPAAEVAAVVEPFLGEDDVIRAHGFQLFIRTTPERMTQVRAMLERLDQPPQRLLVTVRQSARSRGESAGADADVELSNRGSAVRGRVYGTQERNQGGGEQQIQVLEGEAAFIQFGQSVPVGERTVTVGPGGTAVHEGVRYRDVTSGFYVYPRVQGNRVYLRIRPHRNTRSRGDGGTVNIQQAETTLSGPLGAWIPVGGTVESLRRRGSGTVYSTRERSEQQGYIALKVERLPNAGDSRQ